MKKKRTFTPQEKANIVLEILREDETLTEISKKYDIAQPVLSRWKSEFLDGMPRVFDKKGADLAKLKVEHEKEKSELLEKIGSLTIDVDWLKKNNVKSRK